MPDAFDPYFKWLGIPKTDQPPHVYRLLGIELLESDADVISNAADGRMAQIKVFQSGKFSADSQRLLNEIAAAKICLLNPKKKAEYDRRLRAYLEQKKAAANARVEAAGGTEADAAGEENGAGLPFLDYSTTPNRTTTCPIKKSKQPVWLLPAAAGFAALAMGAAVFTYFFAGDSKSKPANPQTASSAGGNREARPNLSAKSPDTVPARTSQPSPRPTSIATAVATEKSRAAVSSPDSEPLRPTPKPEVKPKPKGELVADPETSATAEQASENSQKKDAREATDDMIAGRPPATEKPAPSIALATREGSEAKKPPVPDKEQYQAMRSKILKIFQKEFAEAKTSEVKLALAVKLDEQGDASKDDLAERYALWKIAAEGASVAGEFSLAMKIVDKIEAQFDADGNAMKADLLATGAARTAIAPEAARNLCETALKLAAAAVAREDLDAAAQFAKLATTAVRRAKDPQFGRDVMVRSHEIEHLRTRYSVVAKAMETLGSDADNADANLAVGQWHCFTKSNWEKGLPYLAKGSREDLAALAKLELARPTGAKDHVAVADAWWALAEKDRTDSKATYQARAVHWYERAAPSLAGLEKIRVDKQIAAAKHGFATDGQIAGSNPRSFGPRGASQKGNVATVANGATVSGVKTYAEHMILPNDTTMPTSYGPVPCEFIISLDKVYQLQQIRFLIQRQTSAMYQISISRDGRKFELLQDHSNGLATGWQEFRFAARPVKSIKVTSTAGTANSLSIEHFEAYCYPTAPDVSPNRR